MNKIISEDVNQILQENIPFDKFFGKTVLISGANGYVPAYFVHTFMMLNDAKNAKIHVIALCRNEDKARKRFCNYLKRDDFELLIQDVCNPILTNKLVHIYIHAASPAGIVKRYEDPVNTFLANVKGAENMLNSALKNPCEYFLLLSSVDIYGKMNNNERLKEQDAGCLDTLNIRNMYSCGKRAAESLCKAYQEKYDLPVYIVRPFQIIGPGLALDDGRLHIDFISQMLKGDQIVLKSDGTAIRTFMYITDAITAMFTVMLNGISGEAYNIVMESGEASVKELASVMANAVEGRKVKVVFDYEKRNNIEVVSALSVVIGCSDKLRKLGWIPKFSLEQASVRMMKYYGIVVKEK